MVGHFVETIAFQHARLYSDRIHFWRTPQKDEIDIVLETPTLIPIEVKYRNQIPNSLFRPLIKFLSRYMRNFGIMLTKHHLDKKIIGSHEFALIPTWLFLCYV